MSKILIYEPEMQTRNLLRYILEGISHRVYETAACEDIPGMLLADRADLLILAVRPEQESKPPAQADWQLSLPEVPVLLIFSGKPEARRGFMENWHGPANINLLARPIEPYPLMAMVKSLLTAPEIWRKGGRNLF